MVGGQHTSVVLEIDSIGGNLNAVLQPFATGLKETCDVDASKVVATFRETSMSKFGMNGRALGCGIIFDELVLKDHLFWFL